MSEPTEERELVELLAEEFVRRYRAGEQPDVEAYVAAHPAHAEQIRELFPALVMMEALASSSDSQPAAPTPAPVAERIGDYRIVRRIGAGGMGVVYEAVQESLNRRVALKLLTAQTGRDETALARFRREARAAAQLHHTNIVPVFEVGQCDDVCFYAMQLILGQGLDEVLKELQRLHQPESSPSHIAHSLWTGQFAAPQLEEPLPPTSVTSSSELSGVTSEPQHYFQSVARIGQQVAEALSYAHQRGIVHRDIKPSNLLLDTAGVVWVADFGLAKTEDRTLTETGDIVGTLRYMSPERFRGGCDLRADVYALGLTLYELLTLRPAFDSPDRLKLVDLIARAEPTRPRLLDRRIPRDLETIVLKASDKEPSRRYQSAAEIAEDLRRFQADEPILARQASRVERGWRWCRRNPAVASLMVTVFVVLALGAALSTVLGLQAQRNADAAEERATEARQAEKRADAEREKVKQEKERTDRSLYFSRIAFAHREWQNGNVETTRELLAGLPERFRGWEYGYLNGLAYHPELTLTSDESFVASVAFSPDGKRILAGSGASSMKVMDALTGRVVRTFEGHTKKVRRVAWFPDGHRILSADSDGVVKVWDAHSGKERYSFSVSGLAQYSLAISPDGKRILAALFDEAKADAGSYRSALRAWDAQTGKATLALDALPGQITSLACSHDGKRLVVGNADGTLTIRDAFSGRNVLSWNGHPELDCLAFSPDDQHIVSGGYTTLKLWSAATGQEIWSVQERPRVIFCVAFSPDGRRIASGSGDDTVRIWDARSGQMLRSFRSHTLLVDSVAFSPEGNRLLSGSGDGTVKM